jgi:hypothetical protein
MRRLGKGTGSIRARRFHAMTEAWPICEHRCPSHGVWQHKALPDMACHLSAIMDCSLCLEWPLNSEPSTGASQPN